MWPALERSRLLQLYRSGMGGQDQPRDTGERMDTYIDDVRRRDENYFNLPPALFDKLGPDEFTMLLENVSDCHSVGKWCQSSREQDKLCRLNNVYQRLFDRRVAEGTWRPRLLPTDWSSDGMPYRHEFIFQCTAVEMGTDSGQTPSIKGLWSDYYKTFAFTQPLEAVHGDAYAFSNLIRNNNLDCQMVILHEGTTLIPPVGFYGLENLQKVFNMDAVTEIGEHAFFRCSKLALTRLPAGLTSTGEYAFQGCTSLALTALPDDLTSIGDASFMGCSLLALTTLPAGLMSIGDYTFFGCRKLALTTLPDGLTAIGVQAFYECPKLALTELPADLTSIGAYAFANCSKLALTRLPPRLTSISDSTFSGCSTLALTELPVDLRSIGAYAFFRCSKLALTTLPPHLTSIGDATFSGCSKLALTELPADLTSIGKYAFAHCSKLALTTLPAGLTEIREYTFAGCTLLALTELPAPVQQRTGLTSIGEYAFANCRNLRLKTLPPSIERIAPNAFSGSRYSTDMIRRLFNNR